MAGWLDILRELVEFEWTRVVDEGVELIGARLLAPLVTVRPAGAEQFVFHEHPDHEFEAAVFDTRRRVLRLYYPDGTYTETDVMLWVQYVRQNQCLDEDLEDGLPARSFHNHFVYHTRREDAYRPVFPLRPLRTLGGAPVPEGAELRVRGGFLEAPDGGRCPLPPLRVPPLEFGAGGWLGVGVRGMASVSTDTLAQVADAAAGIFGERLAVVPLDVNDCLAACAGCDDPAVACVCPTNTPRIRAFTFLSHLCLLHNELDEPYGLLASALWVAMPADRAVCVRLEAGVVAVV